MEYNFVYLNAIAIMSHITQKLYSGICLHCRSKTKAINQTPLQLNSLNHSINETT